VRTGGNVLYVQLREGQNDGELYPGQRHDFRVIIQTESKVAPEYNLIHPNTTLASLAYQYINNGNDQGYVGFTPNFPANIIALDLTRYPEGFFVKKGGCGIFSFLQIIWHMPS
jgi:hypothetical protein